MLTVQTILIPYIKNEIKLEDKSLMQPKFAVIGITHGLPKMHEGYQEMPPIRPIVDTTTKYSSLRHYKIFIITV